MRISNKILYSSVVLTSHFLQFPTLFQILPILKKLNVPLYLSKQPSKFKVTMQLLKLQNSGNFIQMVISYKCLYTTVVPASHFWQFPMLLLLFLFIWPSLKFHTHFKILVTSYKWNMLVCLCADRCCRHSSNRQTQVIIYLLYQ